MNMLLRRALVTVTAGSLGLVTIPVVAPPATAAGEPCTQEALRMPAGAVEGRIDATDPTGRYQIGTFRSGDEPDRYAIWRDGVAAEVVLDNGAAPTDVNARGDVAANAPAGPGINGWQGWRWRSGQSVKLPVPPDAAAANSVAINARGEIAGESFDSEGWDYRAVVWSVANVVRVLPRPEDFNDVQVAGIDDDGTVLATVRKWDIPNARVLAERAVVWFPEGGWRFLPGTATDSFVEAVAIRHGAVVGVERGEKTLLWSARSDDATVLTTGATPVDINTNGSVVLLKGVDRHLYQPGAGFRLLPQDDEIMPSGGPSGATDDEQVYGVERGLYPARPKPVRWIC